MQVLLKFQRNFLRRLGIGSYHLRFCSAIFAEISAKIIRQEIGIYQLRLLIAIFAEISAKNLENTGDKALAISGFPGQFSLKFQQKFLRRQEIGSYQLRLLIAIFNFSKKS